jgi:hypothetical protein
MTQQLPLPDLETARQRSAKVQKVCKRADAGILVLDDLIAHLEQDIRSSSLYRYRLNKAKHLLSL